MSTGYLGTYPDRLPSRFDAAVVIPTALRPTLARAIESVYAQRFTGTIQILIGLDRFDYEAFRMIDASYRNRPPNCWVTTFWPGYSTAVRHGGVTPASDGGALRTILTNLANSSYVAYLDDDDWWERPHLAALRDAIAGVDWAYSLRTYAHPLTNQPICEDEWESVGPDAGYFAERFGGYVAPSTLMIDKTRCGLVPQIWCHPLLASDPMSADRRVFEGLRAFTSCGTREPTSFYTINPADPLHPQRVEWMGAAAYEEAGAMQPIDGYVAGVMAHAGLHRARKAEQEAEATRLKDEALADAAAYVLHGVETDVVVIEGQISEVRAG